MDGGIDVRAGATGTTLNQGVTSVAQGNQYGTSVVPTIAAPSHQHFFNFRIEDPTRTTQHVISQQARRGRPAWLNHDGSNRQVLMGRAGLEQPC